MISEFYSPLYDRERGGTPRGFECKLCKKPRMITLTLRGMHMHLRVHKIEYQSELFILRGEEANGRPDTRQLEDVEQSAG